MSVESMASEVRGVRPLVRGLPGPRATAADPSVWRLFRLTYVLLLSGFLMTFVGRLGLGDVGSTLRWVALAACLGAAVRLPRRARGGGAMEVLVGAYVLVALASAAASPYSTLALAKWLAMGLEVALACYVLPNRLSRAGWQWCMDALGWLLVLMVVATAAGWTDVSAGAVERYRGGLDVNPNAVGLTCLFCIAVWMWRLGAGTEGGRRWWRALVPGAAVLASLLSLLLTGSRSSAAGVAAALALWTVVQLRRPAGKRWLVAFVVVIAGLAYLGADFLAPRYEVFLRRGPGGSILSSRLANWERCLQDARRRPYLGMGFGVSSQAGGIDIGVSSVGSLVDGGGYFSLLSSVGILGTVAFGGVLVCLCWRTAGIVLKPSASPLWAFQAAAVVVALSVNMVGEPWLMGPGSPVHLVFWLAAGALSCGVAPGARRLAGRASLRRQVR